ncbi:hypothetical protein ACUN9V_18780 [Salinicola sp. V024]|uniref:hypothetical protein n=1 Tax=Salinicola sp. V024 TaxID=3459609 RepID=UPI00404398A6
MTMTYEAWRISYQSAEQAARAAYDAAVKNAAARDALAAHVERLTQIGNCADMCAFGVTRESELWVEACEDAPETSLAQRDIAMQAKGARLVAEKAWERTQWQTLGVTSQEKAGNLATIVANELSRAIVEPLDGGAA